MGKASKFGSWKLESRLNVYLSIVLFFHLPKKLMRFSLPVFFFFFFFGFLSSSFLLSIFKCEKTLQSRTFLIISHLDKCSVQFSHSVKFHSWRTHGLQHTRPPCPSPTPRVYSNSCPLSQWCHPTISSSVIPFSFHPQSFPASGSFRMSPFFTSGCQVLEFQLQHQSFQWTFRTDFL